MKDWNKYVDDTWALGPSVAIAKVREDRARAEMQNSQTNASHLAAVESIFLARADAKDAKKVGRIRWNGTLATLAYLIGKLADEGLIDSARRWQDAAEHFADSEGKAFKADVLKQTWARFGEGGPRGKEQIGTVLDGVRSKRLRE